MAYPNGKARNVVLLRPKQRNIYYLHFDNAILRGVRELLHARYHFVAIGRKNGRIQVILRRNRRNILIKRV